MDENKSGWFDLGNSKPLISKPPVRGTTRTEKASASGKKSHQIQVTVYSKILILLRAQARILCSMMHDKTAT